MALRGVLSRRTLLLLLASSTVVLGFLLFHQTTKRRYNVPSDSILIAVGPVENDEKSIRLSDFRFIAHIGEKRVNLWGYVSFANDKTNYMDIYLPFVVLGIRNGTYSDITASYYIDSVDRTSSLVHVIFPIRGAFFQHIIDLDIYVEELVSTTSMGEETVILTFGFPHSAQFQSLSKYMGEREIEVTNLASLPVTIGVDKEYFFSAESFPDPDVEYLTKDSRLATWLIEFSGRLANYYRSIHCTAKNERMLQMREVLVLMSGVIMSVGVTLFLDIATHRYALKTESDAD